MTMVAASLDPVSMARIRWRCRRGLLELDIVLGRFIEQYARLDPQQRLVFDTLLDLPDTSLWDMISGKLPALNEEQRELVELINMAGND
jgi:antitoxin CptB